MVRMFPGHRGLAAAVVAAIAAAGVFVAAPPAQARTRWFISDGNDKCFGKSRSFKPGTRILLADWNANGEEEMCIGVAPNRRIFYIQPTSSAWKEVPGGGRADDMINWMDGPKYGDGGLKRMFTVFVANPHDHYFTWWNN